MYIETVFDFNRELAAGPFAWPGGYPRYFITSDGTALSFAAARDNARLIRDAIIGHDDSGWRVVACGINWEDDELFCDQTGERIEPAYGE